LEEFIFWLVRQQVDLLAKEVPFYRLRFPVKPGLTGWAQINGAQGTYA
jgi:lipopolysaccharide/colanic/teichoic acid biosynthesis glycosyltransferase